MTAGIFRNDSYHKIQNKCQNSNREIQFTYVFRHVLTKCDFNHKAVYHHLLDLLYKLIKKNKHYEKQN